MGISREEHLATHPLRGHLFENLVVLEVFKAFYNRGERPNAYFYRDSAQNEADLVLESGDGLRLLEIKAAQTVASDAMRPAQKVAGILGERVKQLALVYGGDAHQQRSAFEVLPYFSIGGWV